MPVMVLMMVTLLVSGCSSGRGSGMTGPSSPTTNEPAGGEAGSAGPGPHM